MKLQVAHAIPLTGATSLTQQAVTSTIEDTTTVVITIGDLEIEIIEGDVEPAELILRLHSTGKLMIVPSAANGIRLRKTRY